MMHVDVAVIGSGPAGQKAAVQAAKAGNKVCLIEQDNLLGGACVHRGTIPSKTLRENAVTIQHMHHNAKLFDQQFNHDIEMAVLLDHVDDVLKAHNDFMEKQINRNLIVRLHGKASFTTPWELHVVRVKGKPMDVRARFIIIATGSIPRQPDKIDVDHEHIFDSDSILSMLYLPQSLTVLGGGVIASEYASIFQAIGCKVTMIDRYPMPLGFLDQDLTQCFVEAFEHHGGTWIGEKKVEKVYWDGVANVVVECEDGTKVESEKCLVAAGRIANVSQLNLPAADVELTDQQLVQVNEQLQTTQTHIFAAGDVIGPPALASTSMDQGRRATCNALGIPNSAFSDLIPMGIYGIPELSSVGLSEQQARKQFGDVMIGKAPFAEIARGQISGNLEGFVKLIADSKGERLLGVQVVGEGATELIHIGQMALIHQAHIDIFIENIFNFPTMAETYRVAALAIAGQRAAANDLY